MLQEEERLPAAEIGVQKNITPYITIIVCAFISMFFMKTGLFSLFYLAPLGYAVIVTGMFQLTFFTAVVVNIGSYLISRPFVDGNSEGMFIDILYNTSLFLGFVWIMGGARFRTAYRFVLAGIAGTLVFIFYVNSHISVFYALLENIAQAFASSDGGDAVRSSVLQQMLTPEKLMESCKSIFLKGGAVVSIFFTLFINRQAANAAVLIIKKRRIGAGLKDFFAPLNVIWVLSGSLAVILLTRLIKLEIIEILAWNVLVICAIIFLAQGGGILMYMLARRTYAVRVLFNVLIIITLFSPLNTIAVAALFLLGVAENWLPFRRSVKGQASTPEL